VAEALSRFTSAANDGGQGSPVAATVQPSDDDDFSFSADARLAALGIVRREPAPVSPEAQAPNVPVQSAPPAEGPAASGQPMAGGVTQASGSSVPSIPGQDFNTSESAPSESSAARLAGLVPSSELPANGRTSGAPVPTHVIVTGLLSVASIASFKRQLSRIPGVQGVGVSSGPDGEFIFKTTHEPGVSLAAVIPTLPGFGAEVVKSGEGTIQVAAHDPEADA
jgi:hypothetical protein